MGKFVFPVKPYGPGQEDYEYDKWRQEQVDDEVEAERLANLKGELLWPDSEKHGPNRPH
jgi:hypothetical protein